MRHKRGWTGVAVLSAGLGAGPVWGVPAFSGAEGWGAITPGGRGGSVIHVTNLNDSGPGSFRAAVQVSGPRTIVFDVSGTINLATELAITNPFVTIAGQTAPGGGICIAGETLSLDSNDIILRYVRIRRGNTTRADDALGSDKTPGRIIIDHVSASWGLDENLSVYRWKNAQNNVFPTHDVTVQWSISSEALNPNRHAFGATWGGKGANFHHNLFASNTGRNPSLSFSHFLDFRNNVLFNWKHRSVDGAGPEAHVNIINNYYKAGPATGFENNIEETPVPWRRFLIVNPEVRSGIAGPGVAGQWYVDGNHVEGYPAITADNWEGGVTINGQLYHGVQWDSDVAPYPGPGPGAGDGMDEHPEWARVLTPHSLVDVALNPNDPNDHPIPPLPYIATQSAQEAYQLVLAGAGAILPVRDAVDQRIMNMVATGLVSGTPNGIINHPNDVGGYPVLASLPAPADSDQDGMPDAWEVVHGLNPLAADNNGDFDADGYTNLEDFLNDIGAFPCPQAITWDGGNGRYEVIDNWDVAFQPSRLDEARIHNGTVTINSAGQHARVLKVAPNAGDAAQVMLSAGWIDIAERLEVASSGQFIVSGGVLLVPAVQMSGAALLKLTPGGNKHLRIQSLSISGSATLDLSDNKLIVVSGDLGSWNGSGYTGVTGLVDSGRIVTSMPDAAGDSPLTGLAVSRAGDVGKTTFAGQNVAPDDVLVMYTYPGDANLDGRINIDDYGRIDGNVSQSGVVFGWSNGDFNYDGKINIDDYGIIDGNINRQGAPIAAITAVPEPACMMVMSLAALLVRRRRHAVS